MMRELGASLVVVALTSLASACSRAPSGEGPAGVSAASTGIAALAPPSTLAEGESGAAPVRASNSSAFALAPAAGAPSRPARATTAGAAASAGAVADATTAHAPVTVVVFMLPPGSDDRAPRPDGRTYKVSLTADTQTATVEIDGRSVGTTQVQRVTPNGRDHERFTVRPSAGGPITREVLPAVDDTGMRARASTPPMGSAASLSLVRHPALLNPNGAPIID